MKSWRRSLIVAPASSGAPPATSRTGLPQVWPSMQKKVCTLPRSFPGCSGRQHGTATPRAKGGSVAVQGVDRLGAAHAAQAVAPDRDQPVGGVGGRAGERLRDQQVAIVLPAQGLDPARLVDGRADDGEVEPIDAADIAVEHVTEMEHDVDIHDELVGRGALYPKLTHATQHFRGSIERGI